MSARLSPSPSAQGSALASTRVPRASAPSDAAVLVCRKRRREEWEICDGFDMEGEM